MNAQRLAERRAFNEALRARMGLIAAQRGVPDDQMKWLGRIRHHDLMKFVRKHQLDWNWVLLGPRKRHRNDQHCASSKAGGHEAPAQDQSEERPAAAAGRAR
jgi:hypothetical protein